MCECLAYDDGSMHLCECCTGMWLEYLEGRAMDRAGVDALIGVSWGKEGECWCDAMGEPGVQHTEWCERARRYCEEHERKDMTIDPAYKVTVDAALPGAEAVVKYTYTVDVGALVMDILERGLCVEPTNPTSNLIHGFKIALAPPRQSVDPRFVEEASGTGTPPV